MEEAVSHGCCKLSQSVPGGSDTTACPEGMKARQHIQMPCQLGTFGRRQILCIFPKCSVSHTRLPGGQQAGSVRSGQGRGTWTQPLHMQRALPCPQVSEGWGGQ